MIIFLAFAFLGTAGHIPPVSRAGQVHLRVTAGGAATPCRITIVDAAGKLAEVQATKSAKLAVRTGVVYTSTGSADISLPPGEYTVYATRGPLYSLAQKKITVGSADQTVELALKKEVDLPGYVSCDTHIHTREFSGHGDSGGAERLVTLAGEEIEMPVSTEHNRQVDYGELAKATGTTQYLTPVVGNEVTTPAGHFNAFPMPAGGTPPPYRLKDRAATLAGIRAVPGVRIITINHTHDTHEDLRPDDPTRFHALSGEALDGQPWDVDAIEVINSSAQQSDPMKLFRNWFALLNSGKPVVAVGASDSHDVNAYIVGQARTYIASSATRPDKIDVEEACRNLKAGKALVSCGLVTEMWVDDKFGLEHKFRVGDLAIGTMVDMLVHVRVRGPRWVRADRMEVYGDGGLIASATIDEMQTDVVKADVTFRLPRPKHDTWLVAIASGPGPGDNAPYWPLSRPYQPTLADWEPRVIGATNPIRVDGDGDGKYTSPHDYAAQLVDAAGGDMKKLFSSLGDYDPAVTVQACAILRQRGTDLDSAAIRQVVNAASPAVLQAFTAYQIVLKREK